MVQKSIICNCFFHLMILIINFTTVSKGYRIVTANYKEMGGCRDVPKSQCPDEQQLRMKCEQDLIWDKCLSCKTCPKQEGEVCGGPYYMHGVCKDKLLCIKDGKEIPRTEVLHGVNITGTCRPKACRKDCSTRTIKMVCGSDGVWRENNCYLNQVNCNLAMDDPRRIHKVPASYCKNSLPVSTSAAIMPSSSSKPTTTTMIPNSITSSSSGARSVRTLQAESGQSSIVLPTNQETR